MRVRARASSLIASKFRSTVSLSVRGKRASARNIVAVMLLTASVGATVRIEIDGPDEAEAMREIAALFNDGFGERLASRELLMVSFALNGLGVSGGIAIGRAQLVSHATLEVAHYTIPASKVEAEIARFDQAVNEVQRSSRACTAR